jgi:hypothetical protein
MGGMPLGEATMWERRESTADAAMGIFLRLARLAADGEVREASNACQDPLALRGQSAGRIF